MVRARARAHDVLLLDSGHDQPCSRSCVPPPPVPVPPGPVDGSEGEDPAPPAAPEKGTLPNTSARFCTRPGGIAAGAGAVAAPPPPLPLASKGATPNKSPNGSAAACIAPAPPLLLPEQLVLDRAALLLVLVPVATRKAEPAAALTLSRRDHAALLLPLLAPEPALQRHHLRALRSRVNQKSSHRPMARSKIAPPREAVDGGGGRVGHVPALQQVRDRRSGGQ